MTITSTKDLLAGQKAQLRTRMAELRAQIESIKESSAPLQAELDVAIALHNAAGEKVADLAARVDAIEQPALHELKTELAEVARAESAIKGS